jgi:glyoxylase-like metal-dependent hydrolase (beta-lactamase superfamily II)
MQPLTLGKIDIRNVEEVNVPTSPRFLFPGIAPADFKPHEPWLAPHFYDPAADRLRMPIQAFIVRTPHHTLIVDTCLGNDKELLTEGWGHRNGPFLAHLKAAGVSPEEVDFVLCTHLHTDHVGWNTRLVNGRWEPTFPNARYVLNRTEYEHWSRQKDGEQALVFRESVLPVLESGKAELVDGEHEVTEGIWLEPTPGHTPGHVSVRIGTGDALAVITGDLMHHPIQILEPERATRFDWDQTQGRHTRRSFLERYAERDVRIVGTHFAAPTYGRVVGHQRAFRLAV